MRRTLPSAATGGNSDYPIGTHQRVGPRDRIWLRGARTTSTVILELANSPMSASVRCSEAARQSLRALRRQRPAGWRTKSPHRPGCRSRSRLLSICKAIRRRGSTPYEINFHCVIPLLQVCVLRLLEDAPRRFAAARGSKDFLVLHGCRDSRNLGVRIVKLKWATLLVGVSPQRGHAAVAAHE